LAKYAGGHCPGSPHFIALKPNPFLSWASGKTENATGIRGLVSEGPPRPYHHHHHIRLFKSKLISYLHFCFAFVTGNESMLSFMRWVGLTGRGLLLLSLALREVAGKLMGV
jgi:hypothetical protein